MAQFQVLKFNLLNSEKLKYFNKFIISLLTFYFFLFSRIIEINENGPKKNWKKKAKEGEENKKVRK